MSAALYADYDACLGVDAPTAEPHVAPEFSGEPGEDWRDVVGWEGRYEVSSLGNVRSGRQSRIKYGRRLSPSINRGYSVVALFRVGESASRAVHSLVAEAFIGPRPPGYVVDHIDGIKAHNGADNLEYVLPRENSRRASRLGLLKRGTKHCAICCGTGHNRSTCGKPSVRRRIKKVSP